MENRIKKFKECTVLFAEDDSEILKQVGKGLVNVFKKVYLCKDGQTALKTAEEEEIDILISDLNMPKISGVELIQHIREKHRILPIVITTGFDDFTELYKDTINIKLITKPYDIWMILDAIEEIQKKSCIDCHSCDIAYQKLESVTKKAEALLNFINQRGIE